jgi:hypothetical protein
MLAGSWIACNAVRAVVGKPAPFSAKTPGGLFTVDLIGATAYSTRSPPLCNKISLHS